MWSSDRRKFLAVSAAALLGGCGFKPAYGPDAAATGLLGGVEPDAPETRDDFALVQRLSERLGSAVVPKYALGYKVSVERRSLAITSANATTRYTLSGGVTYQLRDSASRKLLLSGEVQSFTSWSATGSVVATQAAEEDAHRRLMVILADRMVTQLIAQSGALPG